MKVVDYIVVRRNNDNDLASAVKDKLKEGWQPFGGLSVAMVNRYESYNQAMVRYEGDPTPIVNKFQRDIYLSLLLFK